MASLAPALVGLRDRLNSLYPKRDKASDGWIGDAAHSSRESDHNPDWKGMVHAIDVDKDGINVARLLKDVIGHPAVNYVIHNRVIYSRVRGFKAHAYTGSNPHTKHVHISIRYTTAAENWSGTWLPTPKPTQSGSGVPKTGDKDRVAHLQRVLGLKDDGLWGPKTDELATRVMHAATGAHTSVKQLQELLRDEVNSKIKIDGKRGPVTDAALKVIVAQFQRVMHVSPDNGLWGPKTDAAFRKFRNENKR